MEKLRITDFTGGWFVGDFKPSLFQNKFLEVGVKFFQAGDKERSHKQLVATEVTVVIEGTVRIEDLILNAGDVLVIYPGEFADFEALTNGSLTCVKFPSIPSDKVLK